MPRGREDFWAVELAHLRTEFEIFGSSIPPQDITKEPFFRLEKAMYYSAFVLRKLIQASKISKELKKLRVECLTIPSQSEPKIIEGIVTFHHGSSVSCVTEEFQLNQICGELIHAADFEIYGGVDSFVFSSDHHMKERYLELKLADWLMVIDKAIEFAKSR